MLKHLAQERFSETLQMCFSALGDSLSLGSVGLQILFLTKRCRGKGA